MLHLIMRRKPRHFEFPALRFIQQRHDVNRRQLRLRHLLLLLLRVLAIAMLALALARPSVKFSGKLGSQQAPVAAALIFDTSKRTEYQQENRTRLEVAQEMGQWLLDQLPGESQIMVLDTRHGPAAFQVDRAAAKHRIQRLSTLANSRPLSDAIDEALQLFDQSELTEREVYIFSDMAQVSWPAESAAGLRDRISQMPGLNVYVIDVGVEEPTNSALGELRLSSQVLSKRTPLRIQTELSHVGTGGERTVELHLLEPEVDQDGQVALVPRKADEQPIKVQSGQSQQIKFEKVGLDVGTHQGYVQIVGQDGLSCDNRRYFSVEVRPAWRILMVAPKPARRYTFFITQMLAPASYVREGRAQFDCETISSTELLRHPLEPYSAVYLLDPTPLTPADWQKLGNYVSDGHGLAIFLGRNADPVESFNQPTAQELLAGKLLRKARRPDGLHLAPRDFQHPVLAAFRGRTDSIPWNDLPVYRYWQLDKPAGGVHVVVPYNNGRPAILERPVGKGRVLTVTTPASDDPNDPNLEPWNLLPVGESWPFFILANQMASYLVGGSDRQLNYFAGQTAVLELDPRPELRSYKLTALDAPEIAQVRLTPDLRQQTLVVAATDNEGNYRVQAGGSESGVDQGFSVNLATEQTRLERVSNDELADVFGSLPYRVTRTRNDLEINRSLQRTGRELFPILILLVAVALGIEQVMANRFYRE